MKKYILSLLVFLSLLMISVLAVGENREDTAEPVITVDPLGQSEGYMAVMYDNTNGLPTSEANDIVETSEGFIWIGGYSGLIRYDGNTFERIDSTTGIASVVCLFVDSRDRLWIGTNDSGVAVMEKGEIRMWGKKDGLQSVAIRAITEDSTGTIYVATTNGIAAIDHEMNLRMLEDSQIVNAYMRNLRLGPDDTLYGLTQDGDIFSMKNQVIQLYRKRDDLRVQ
ncbi:MAG: histidine kinase, partial [Clostridia bacterium]|nr:histidine kinase [Clostridia bacterium]